MKKLLVIFLFTFSIATFSQFKLTGYFDQEIGVSYQFSNKLQTELRIHDNLNSEFNTALSLLYTFSSQEDYNLNIGIGISTYLFHSSNIDLFESISVPFQIEITPLQSTKNLAIVLETAYHYSDYFDDSGIRNSVGIRYIFN